MATFCVEIADESVGRVITAMCANYGYQAMISNPNWNPAEPTDPVTNPEQIPNPETPDQFANRMTRDYLMNNTHIKHGPHIILPRILCVISLMH